MQASNLASGTYTNVSIQAISKNVLLSMQQAGHTELLHEIMGDDIEARLAQNDASVNA